MLDTCLPNTFSHIPTDHIIYRFSFSTFFHLLFFRSLVVDACWLGKFIRSPEADGDDCHVIINDKSTEFMLATVVEEESSK